MIPFTHQTELAKEGLEKLKSYGICYLSCEERTGKTLAAILLAEDFNCKSVLVITKKKALGGWHETLAAFPHTKNYTVTNYHQAHKQHKHDLVIMDEAHNYISAFPKPGKIWKELRYICRQCPIVYLSATPHAQGYQQLYHQFALSSYTPWPTYSNFYNWFRSYGKPYTLEINGIQINQYNRCHEDRVWASCEHLFLTKSRHDLGFEHEPTDKIHMIELDKSTRHVYNELLDHNIVDLKAGTLVCDTNSKLRFSLHMLEGGVAKIDENYIVLANREKITYIKEHFGDHEGLVIMHNYKAEEIKLNMAFKQAKILQATSYAEGVDLHKYSDLVIYSQDFSTARHTQRRARQANKNRDTPIIVHYLLVKKGISEQVYKTVSLNKKNFVDSRFKRTAI